MDGKLTLQEKAVEAAARFLRIRGYEMLATEWRPHEAKGAIDLVARDPESDELVFVDVAAVFVNKEIDISLCRFSTLRWQAPTHLPS